MVWGCFSANGVGNLVFIDGIMHEEDYLRIIQNNLQKSAEKMGMLAPKHTATIVNKWFDQNGIEVLPWGGQSPDMNPIEHIWDDLERRINRKGVSSLQKLKEELQIAWNRTSLDTCQKLVRSFPERCRSVIKAKCGPTKY